MAINDRDIWAVALMMLQKHGKGAAGAVQRHADTARTERDAVEMRIWALVSDAVDELLKSEPECGERVH
jgi:hypothetical protein